LRERERRRKKRRRSFSPLAKPLVAAFTMLLQVKPRVAGSIPFVGEEAFKIVVDMSSVLVYAVEYRERDVLLNGG